MHRRTTSAFLFSYFLCSGVGLLLLVQADSLSTTPEPRACDSNSDAEGSADCYDADALDGSSHTSEDYEAESVCANDQCEELEDGTASVFNVTVVNATLLNDVQFFPNWTFSYKGYLYDTETCNPVLSNETKNGDIFPSPDHCNIYARVESVEGNFVTRRILCNTGTIYSDEMKSCVEYETFPEDCDQNLFCNAFSRRVSENYIKLANSAPPLSEPKSMQEIDSMEIKLIKEDMFLHRDHLYYLPLCLPVLRKIGDVAPLFSSCNGYATLGKIKEVTYLYIIWCKRNRVYDQYEKRCKDVEKLPQRCFKTSTLCDRRIGDISIDQSKSQNSRKKRSITEDGLMNVMMFNSGEFSYKGHTYDENCEPADISFGERAPYYSDCHMYFERLPEELTVQRCEDNLVFSHDSHSCIDIEEPEDCINVDGCPLPLDLEE